MQVRHSRDAIHKQQDQVKAAINQHICCTTCKLGRGACCVKLSGKCSSVQGTVLIKNAEELQSYSQGEEDRMEQVIKGIADS